VFVVLSPLPWVLPFVYPEAAPLEPVHILMIMALLSFSALLAALMQKWRGAVASTPWQTRLRRFRELEMSMPSSSRACDIALRRSVPGAGRAVALCKIVRLLDAFDDYIRERNAYYLDTNVTRPLTKRCQLSYAEAVGGSQVMFFASHFWGNTFRHFVQALQRHAEDAPRWGGTAEPGSVSYWVCFLSNNQWHLSEELGHWSQSSFYKALISDSCLATCMVLDIDALPLTRTWCLFELLQTFKLQKEKENFQGLLFCTSSGVLNTGRASYDAAVALAKRLSTLRVEDATASNQQDKAMIDGLINAEGGFLQMNSFLRSEAKDAMGAVRDHFMQDFENLGRNLSQSNFGRNLSQSEVEDSDCFSV
jgi:hypothetical protein